MDEKSRFERVKRNTDEIITEAELKKLLRKKNPVVYWGTSITGKPHAGYLFPMLKVSDLLKAGFKVKILLADLHGALDNTPWDLLEKRFRYYKKIIPAIIKAIGIDIKNLEIVKGSDFQLSKEYVRDVYKISSLISIHDSKKAASEVVKQGDNPKVSGLLYPLMQALDEEYLNVDAQLGGTDQRKIFVLARENLPKIGYKPRVEILTPLIPGLIGKKMSSSNEKTKIDLLDSPKIVKEKLKSAECIAGDPDNGVLAFTKFVLMTIKQDSKEKFIIKRPEKYGGDLAYSNYNDLEKDFIDKKLHPLDLKNAVADEISKILEVVQKDKKIFELAKIAYP